MAGGSRPAGKQGGSTHSPPATGRRQAPTCRHLPHLLKQRLLLLVPPAGIHDDQVTAAAGISSSRHGWRVIGASGERLALQQACVAAVRAVQTAVCSPVSGAGSAAQPAANPPPTHRPSFSAALHTLQRTTTAPPKHPTTLPGTPTPPHPTPPHPTPPHPTHRPSFLKRSTPCSAITAGSVSLYDP